MRLFSTSARLLFNNAETKQMRAQLDETLKLFKEKVSKIKSDTSVTTEKYKNIAVDLGNGNTTELKQISTIALRGNNINIVAFDPKQVKRMQTALIQKLGVSATLSPHNTQTLLVPVQTMTGERRAQQDQLMKKLYEQLRNDARDRNSISSIRQKYLQPVRKRMQKKEGESKPELKKESEAIEKLVREYQDKLTDLYKKQ